MRPQQTSERAERSVNNLLHTLRGEQFRQSQNVLRSRSHVSSTFVHTGNPTQYDAQDPGRTKAESWTLASTADTRITSTWRARALHLIFGHRGLSLPAIPPLTQLCLRILASTTFSNLEFVEEVVPVLPSHLCREFIRYTAIHAPLPSSKLYAMYAHEGHADGELLIVGPQATIRDDFFVREDSNKLDDRTSQDSADWDSEKSTPPPLSTFILMSTPMATSIVLSLPPTITHMALLNLPAPIALHRLPGVCPLLEILDLSYNTWLTSASRDAPKILERVEWGRWKWLRVLGMRECFVSDEMLQKLNKGRWDDVEIVERAT